MGRDGVLRMSTDVSVIATEPRHDPVRLKGPGQARKREDSRARLSPLRYSAGYRERSVTNAYEALR